MKYLRLFENFIIETKYYRENPDSTFTHNDEEYNLNKLLQLTQKDKSYNFPIKELKWILPHTKVYKNRVEKADISFPILIGKMDNKWVVYDGVHRLTKAIEEKRKTIKVIKVSNYILNKCKIKKINESKQVGILYHYTTIDSILDIIEDNSLNSESGSISFTRDSRMHDVSAMNGLQGAGCRLVINGDVLSNNYKISPFNYFYPDYDSARPSYETGMEIDGKSFYSGTESEEVVKTNSIKNIKKYLIRIDFIYGNKNKWYNEVPSDRILNILKRNNIEYKLIH